jgi:hypothetical protein
LDIEDWLREIGLEQYAQTFRDNAINADVLRKAIGEPPEDPLKVQQARELLAPVYGWFTEGFDTLFVRLMVAIGGA